MTEIDEQSEIMLCLITKVIIKNIKICQTSTKHACMFGAMFDVMFGAMFGGAIGGSIGGAIGGSL